jgi:hypothetical protein
MEVSKFKSENRILNLEMCNAGQHWEASVTSFHFLNRKTKLK